MGLLTKIKSVKSRWWWLIGAIIAVIVIILSQPEKKENFVEIGIDPETTPTMFTKDARSLVSDSGYTRYLIEAPVWYVFDEAAEPNWKFNKGLYLEQYDDTMGISATFICDSAIYLSNPKLWEFIGNVRMRNQAGDRFLTNKMYWDSGRHKIYSDSFIHIERTDRVIEGYGFETDERIANYTVRRPTMIIPVSDFNRRRDPAPEDTIPDSPTPTPDTPKTSLLQSSASQI